MRITSGVLGKLGTVGWLQNKLSGIGDLIIFVDASIQRHHV